MTCKSRHVHVFILAYKAHGKKNKENIKSRHTQKKHKVENHDKQIIRWERNDVRGNKNLQRYSAGHWGHLKVEVCLRRQDPDPSKKNKKKKNNTPSGSRTRFQRKTVSKKNLCKKEFGPKADFAKIRHVQRGIRWGVIRTTSLHSFRLMCWIISRC